MPEKDKDQHYRQDLVEHLFSAKDPQTLEDLLSDLLTPSEFSEVSKRLQIFRLLEAGLPQRQIAEQLGVGIATVTRGSRALKSDTKHNTN
ncbi:trp operon repressor [Spongiibacter taiwanensis]|uniref:Trp family transcriptional regulator n=1 Tax=Spongiibacter taiwanensis TaxID=1748242 RepID=UPI0020357055|nr:Trp family transcriptional regulator [Spongiibacter taiwanensis]USA43887.1 trp operon repressor [Spongiibacter taiwanensis]